MSASRQPTPPASKRVINPKPSDFPPVTAVILTLCASVYVGLAIQNNYDSIEAVARFGYLPAPLVYAGGYWSLITSAFVHFHIVHLVFNAAWVLRLGSSCERVMGWARYLVFYAIAAFVSSAMQLAISGNTGIGASGVVYALFGFMWVTRQRIPAFARGLDRQIIQLFVGWLFVGMGLSYFNILNIGNTAHASGLAFGMLVGAVAIRYRTVAAIFSVFGGITVSAISLFWSPWSIQWLAYKAFEAHQAKSYGVALEYYNRLLHKDDENAWAYYNRAVLHESIGNRQLARADWDRAHALDPSIGER